MTDKLHVDLIRQYILDKPGRPFEEVKFYAQSIGASETALKQAVFQVSEQMLNISPEQLPDAELTNSGTSDAEQSPPSFTPSSFLQYAPLFVALIFIGVGMLFFSFRPPEKAAITENQPKPVQASAASLFTVQPVFAHQRQIDTSKVFSVPTSGIDLKYTGKPTKEVLGFFPYWMLDNQDKVNLDGVTDLALFGLSVEGHGNIMVQSPDGSQEPGWKFWNDSRIDTLISRARRKNIKVLLSFKCFNNEDIASLLQNQSYQKQFIANAIELLRSKSLNGVNIDFEYLGDTSDTLRGEMIDFLRNLNDNMKKQLPNSFLSIDTFISSAESHDIFDISALSQISDKIIVMGYDIHTPQGDPGPIAPMQGPDGITGNMESYLTEADPSKLLLGVAYYGYDWVLDNNSDKNLNAGVPYAIARYAASSTATLWDSLSQTPYYRYVDSGLTHVVHFENTQSLGIKYDFVNKQALGGIAIWALGYDGDNKELGQLAIEKFK